MKLVIVLMALMLFGCDNDKPPQKKYTYTISIADKYIVQCKKYMTNGGSEMGGILKDCSLFGESLDIKEIRNATNVIVEEVK